MANVREQGCTARCGHGGPCCLQGRCPVVQKGGCPRPPALASVQPSSGGWGLER